jgi:Na+-driven multidrug efflux pump
VVLLYNSDIFLITLLHGPNVIREYYVPKQLFNIIPTSFGLISMHYWVDFTKAYSHKDVNSIVNKIKQLSVLIFPFLGLIVFFSIFYSEIISLWLKKDLNVEIITIVLMATYSFICIWNNIFITYLNGASRTRIIILVSLISATLYFILSFIFYRYTDFGFLGIPYALILSLLLFSIVLPIYVLNDLRRLRLSIK